MSDDFKSLVNGLYDLLLPVTDAELRKRAVKSALVMLGEDPGFVEQKQQPKGGGSSSAHHADDDGGADHNAKAARWMERNKISAEQIGHVFHVDGETVEIIADKIPGAKQGEKVINTYVLVGIRELFRTGEPRFADELARTECERMGTHGKTNHATYLKTPGKALTGSVKAGWTLTVPGLTAGAELVKELAGES
ncbi:hypothetical protein CK489_02160 [Bradyrhizobium sp. UFLA03-84]|uniref:hypothetical protein n=1 Tax=Bradyrhizobium sp. UFLA03-84 TaxID=418599 RepID=UPI000BAE4011|nr:hypothetical protein [Bradyrhizobium sp. UFLA03-84]PAY10971.1 hypothetical protein CK489_02160 [Bradyrhizobium sp. UFLA03-84]